MNNDHQLNNVTCRFFDVASYNEDHDISSNNFNIFHFNIRSAFANYDEFSLLIRQLKKRPTIIILTETWFSPTNILEIPNYEGFHTYREDKRGGGVSIYVNSDLSIDPLFDISICDEFIESIAIQVTVYNFKIIVVGIYRPPDKANIPTFIDRLTPIISLSSNNKVIIAGDFNINLLDPNNSESIFIEDMYAAAFTPAINLATNNSNHAQDSCIDHIWLSQNTPVVSGVFNSVDITDHYPIFASFFIPTNKTESNFLLKTFRDHSIANKTKLGNDLRSFVQSLDLSSINNVNDKTSYFLDKLYEIYNSNCPIRTKSVSMKLFEKPWITDKLKKCIDRKYVLFRQFKQKLIRFDVYNDYKNAITSILKKAKKRFYYNKFQQSMKNPQDTWKNINTVMNRSKKHSPVNQIELNGESVVDRQTISNKFNDYFANIGANVTSSIPDTNTSPLSFMGERIGQTIFLNPSTPIEVENIIKSMKNKSSNLYYVPIFIFKEYKSILTPILSLLFNESLQQGIFPDCLKVARVIPVFKSGSRKDISNYRPISTLPILSKIFEKLMFNRINSFININNVVSDTQFGFRQKRSTCDALSRFVDETYDNLNESKTTLAVFLDFSKAFDTVDHQILLKKLDYIGIRGAANRWFESYLSNRYQYVDIENTRSKSLPLKVGVPQGTILGPQIFILYSNDICKTIGDNLKIFQYADDCAIIGANRNVTDLYDTVNNNMMNVVDWLHANKLLLNVKKTNYMQITNKKVTPDNLNIKINNIPIVRVESAKFLGVLIDARLNFQLHVNGLCSTISRVIGVLNRLASEIPTSAKMLIYKSLVCSKIDYCITTYGGSSQSNVVKIDRLLRKARKIVLFSERHNNVPRHVFDFHSRFVYGVCVRTHKILNGYIENDHFLQKVNALLPNHVYGTRQLNSNIFNIPYFKKSVAQKSFLYQCTKYYNLVPMHLKSIKSMPKFKQKLLQFVNEKFL